MTPKSYPTDLTDAQWEQVEPHLPEAKPDGRPRSADMREVLNTLLCQARTGYQWELLPTTSHRGAPSGLASRPIATAAPGNGSSTLCAGRCGSPRAAATCREILKVEVSLWTFAKAEGVEPTNNAAERALRHAVCWRKTRFEADSADGSRLVERLSATIETCRRQGRDLLDFLVRAIEADRSGETSPSLIPTGA